MKKVSFIFACVILTYTSSLAQISDKLVPHMGFTYEIINMRRAVTNISDRSLNFYTFNFGTYYTLLHHNDVVSLGVDPSVHFGFNFLSNGQRTAVNFVVQTPVFLMGRLGATATKYNQQRIGIGAGVGGVYTYFSEGLNNRRANGFNPSAVFEVTFLSRQNTITGRLHIPIVTTSATYVDTENSSGNIVYNEFSNWGIGLIYGF